MNIEEFQQICKMLPGTTEDIKWEHDFVFSVGAKMFCVIGMDESPITASFKVTENEFDDLCNRKGIIPAPYMAKHKWIKIENINKINKKEWGKLLQQSYDLVKAKLPLKKQKQINLLK